MYLQDFKQDCDLKRAMLNVPRLTCFSSMVLGIALCALACSERLYAGAGDPSRQGQSMQAQPGRTGAYEPTPSGLVRSESSPASQAALTRLIADMARAMEKLQAPLGLNNAELASMVAPALELVDGTSGRPYRTSGGRPLPFYVFEPEVSCQTSPMPSRTVLFIGGIHADEVSPLYSSFRALNELLQNPRRRPPNTRLIYAPLTNPDGLILGQQRAGAGQRHNGRGVDLNRDFASKKPQVETRFIRELIERYAPTHIVALHGPFGWLDYDGPGEGPEASDEDRDEAEHWLANSAAAGRERLPVNSDFGTYRGSMGTYGGTILKRHVLTIEYPHEPGRFAEADWHAYGDMVIESLNPGGFSRGASSIRSDAR